MQATFYILDKAVTQLTAQQSGLTEGEPDHTIPAHFDLAAQLAAHFYRQGQKIFILTENQQDAHVIDEYLWAFDVSSFVPHNLQGEGPAGGAPVEIGCEPPVGNRKLLINLSLKVPQYIKRFNQVIDFVPAPEELKQAARERYKQLRANHYSLSTEHIKSQV